MFRGLTGEIGTTGTPKGVDVTHSNVINLVCNAPGNLGMTHGMKVGSVLSVGFDMGKSRSSKSIEPVINLIPRRMGDFRRAIKWMYSGSSWGGLEGDSFSGMLLLILWFLPQTTIRVLTYHGID